MSGSNTFADSNRVGIRAIPESNAAWGVTPASGNTRELRLTSSSLVAAKETVVSDEIRADRMVSSVVEVAASSNGEIGFELSAGSHDQFMQAFVLGQWTRPMEFDKFEGATVSVGATNRFDISGVDVTAYFTNGRRIKTSGFENAENNRYWEVQGTAFVGGSTQVTVTTSTAVVETGSSKTKLQDANDVIILDDTNIRAGTGGASSFDSNGNNSFAAAITAGQLVVGQEIYVEGLGYAEGTVDHTSQPIDTETVVVSDGTNTVTFEYDSGAGVTAGNIAVTIGGTGTDTATNLKEAINAQRVAGNLNCSATSSGVVTTVRNLTTATGSLTETSATVTAVDFAGGDTTVGFYNITALTDDEVTVSPTPPTNANAGGFAVTIKGSMLRNPDGKGNLPHQLIQPQSFTLETAFNDVNQYLVQDGMRVGGFSLEVETGSIVTGAYTFEGRETKRRASESTLLGAAPYTVLDSTATEVMNATTNVGSLEKNGSALATAIQSISLEGEASLRAQPAVGSKFPCGVGAGRFNLTGSVTAYFQDGSMYDDFLNHETVALSWHFTDLEKNTYKYTIPAMKFSEDEVAPGGIDEDIIENISFTAFRDPATGCMFQIDRFSNTEAVTAS